MSSRPCPCCGCSNVICPPAKFSGGLIPHLAPLLEGDPDLTGIVRFERRRWAAPRHWPEMLRSLRWMRAQNFDWVIDLQCLARSGAFAWLANGQFLIGLDEVREGARGFYDVAIRRASFHTHAVDWYLAVLPRLGVPVHNHFQWLPERPDIAAAVKSKWQTDGARWIAIQPGARWENKRWPAEYFAELVRLLAKKFPDARFAILGTAEDKPLGEDYRPSRTATLPESVRTDFVAGNGRMAAAVRIDGHQRHRPDARGRRARQAARCLVRPHRTAPHRPVWPFGKCAAH